MGLFGPKESEEEIYQKVSNSEAGQLFANGICNMLSEGDDHFKWLMGNAKERMFKLDVYTNGVQLTWIEVNRHRLKETNTYDVDKEGWSFGASGYSDLPNMKYCRALHNYIVKCVGNNCPSIKCVSNDSFMLNDNVLKGW